MGDLSVEPSMEDILSSIKRIIAEEGDLPQRPRRTPSPRAATPVADAYGDEDDEDDDGDEVLELSDPMPTRTAPMPSAASPSAQPPSVPPAAVPPTPAAPPPVATVAPTPAPSAPTPAEDAPRMMSDQAAQATRGALDSLSRMLVRPEPSSDGTLEGLVREMLRPMLAQWIDTNLPPMVEAMVAREIAKITGETR